MEAQGPRNPLQPVLNLLMRSAHLMASYKTSGLKRSNIDSVYGNLVLHYCCF